MSTVLTRDDIRVIEDISIEPVEVPEWGGMLYVKGLTGTARDAFELAMFDQRKSKSGRVSSEINLKNLRAKLVVQTAVDSDNVSTAKRIFTDSDVEWLGSKSAAALQRVYAVAQRLSGLSNEDVDEMTSDLGNDQSDGSGSDSQATSATVPSLEPSKR